MRTALLAMLLCFPVSAAEPVQPDVVCEGPWCAIKRETLKTLIVGIQKMSERQAQLERLCGWNAP